ncbi:MAG: hypothetical protein IJO33_05545 [Bacilli bacterium]|nr:hypothetical protein [Bacilli bacterium]
MEKNENKALYAEALKSKSFNAEQLAKIIEIELDTILTELNNVALKYNICAKTPGKYSPEIAQLIMKKYNILQQAIKNNPELGISLWLDNKYEFLTETQENKDFRNFWLTSSSLSNDARISKIPDDKIFNDLLKSNMATKNIAIESGFYCILAEMHDIFHNSDKFLLPVYDSLSVDQLPIPLSYNYSNIENARSLIKFTESISKKFTKFEKPYLIKALEISKQQFLRNWASEALIPRKDLYAYKEKEKEILVDANINGMLEALIDSQKDAFCFGTLSDKARKSFSVSGYNPENPEHAHMHSIFTHYMTTEELQSSPAELKKVLAKFRMEK